MHSSQCDVPKSVCVICTYCMSDRQREVKRGECVWSYMLLHSSSHTSYLCASQSLAVCLWISCSFQCQCLADCANLFEMAPAGRFPGKNSKRMECAANKVGLAPPSLSELLCFGQSLHPCLRSTQFAVIDSAPAAHARDLNSGQDFWKLSAIDSQFSLSFSLSPDGKNLSAHSRHGGVA